MADSAKGVLDLETVVRALEGLGAPYPPGAVSADGLRQWLAEQLAAAGGLALDEALARAPVRGAYDHFVVLDFEATCVDRQTNPTPQEIIEFPVVVVAVRPRPRIIADLQLYVRPRAHPTLTPFCIELTGITQAQVDAGLDFVAALRRVEEFLFEKLGLQWQKTICVTNGDWDLASMLPRQCAQCGISVPKWAAQFVNVNVLWRQTVPPQLARSSEGTGSIHQMLAAAGMEFEGRLHSGLDDSRNIARVLCWLLLRGAVVNGPLEARRDDQPLRPGDWRCPTGCGVMFASRAVCRDCGAPRPAPETATPKEAETVTGPVVHTAPRTGGPPMRPGDWVCPKGCGLQFAVRSVCRDCAAPRPDVAPAAGAGTFGGRPGDWTCPKGCGLQFARRFHCRDCGSPKPV